MSSDSKKTTISDPVGDLARELGVKILKSQELPKAPHSLKKERPPILLLREVQQNLLITRKKSKI